MTIRDVINATSQVLQVPVATILGRNNHRSAIVARHLAIWMARKTCRNSIAELGTVFLRDRRTIQEAIAKIEDAQGVYDSQIKRIKSLLPLGRIVPHRPELKFLPPAELTRPAWEVPRIGSVSQARQWLVNAPAGHTVEYHRGPYADGEICDFMLTKSAATLVNNRNSYYPRKGTGELDLMQVRLGQGLFQYLATKRAERHAW